MKYKSIIGVLGAGLLATSVMATDVGEKMPSYKDHIPAGYMDWTNDGEAGIILHIHDAENMTCKYEVAFRACKGKLDELPFGILDVRTKKLYLDNNPIDGIVDEIVDDARGRYISDDCPPCLDKVEI